MNLIQEMSMKFTKKREQIGDYVLDEDRVSAYTALYLPTNIPKLHFLLSQLTPEILDDLKKRPLVDVGSGPGTFSLGWSLLFKSPPPEVTCIDSSKVMLEQAKKILTGFFPEINLKTQSRVMDKKTDAVLFFGHSINEIGINKVQDQIMMVDPEYVVWIEPGTSDLFLELKKLRSTLIESYDVLYPCPSNSACPSDWCHQVLRTSHESSIERLSQLVSLDRKILPMTAHVYKRRSTGIAPKSEATIIRFLNETKFSFEYEVCTYLHNENKNIVVEIQKKHLDKRMEKKFKNMSVGEKIQYSIDKVVGEKYRIKLLDQ